MSAGLASPLPVVDDGSAPSITVRVRLFASYREAAGTSRLELQLPSSSRVGDLLDLLAERIPAVKAARGMTALNQEYVGPEAELHDGDEVAFIPPVSGG
jgi:molybdopterin converting factor subunit 1